MSDSSRAHMVVDVNSESGQRMRHSWVKEALENEVGASLALAPGKMIPGTRYRVQRWLGDGSMGVVYAAEHVDIGRTVAVKILRGHGSPVTAVKAFRQEARVASQVGSEHIVQVLDFAELPNGRLMFVMEFVDGRPLNRELRRGAMSIARTIGILRQVAKGLGAAHAAKVIHRDVKPDNIMIEAQPRQDRARLLDFGVASISKTVERTAGDLVGTPFYVAPEILEGESYDELVDLYSLGCTAYEMLSGHPPFEYDSVEALLKAHILEPPTPLHEIAPSVPRELSDVVMRCLAKRPQQRYPTMDEFEAALIEAQIAIGEITAWDDLPLPDVDPERRVRLLEGLNPAEPARSRWPLLVAAAALLTTAVVGGYAMMNGGEVAVTDRAVVGPLEQIDRLTATVRGAAKRHNWVYPSPENPSAPTSYTALLELESITHEAAAERGAELRKELAGELRSLGDAFWARNPDSGIAAEFYAQALIFDPTDELAKERSARGEDGLAALASSAATLEFDMDELIAFEPLLIISERNRVLRRQRLERYLQRKAEAREGVGIGEEVEAMAAEPFVLDLSQRTDAEAGEPIEAEAEAEAEDETGGEPEMDAIGQNAEAVAARKKAEAAARKAAARTSAADGDKALQAGDLSAAEAHFKAALDKNPRLALAHDGLARTYFNRSNFDRAIKHGKKAVKLAPSIGAYRLHLGDAYFKRGDLQEALDSYEAAVAHGRSDAKSRVSKVKSKLGQ